MFDSVWYNHNMKTVSIRWRLFLMFLLLLGPVCVLILFIQGKFYGIMKHQASMYTAQYIEKISYDIELNLSELDKMAVALQKDARWSRPCSAGTSSRPSCKWNAFYPKTRLRKETEALFCFSTGAARRGLHLSGVDGLLRTLGPEWMNKIISATVGACSSAATVSPKGQSCPAQR